jgi:thiol-disulfide isomerase/thioredoxin
VVASEAGVEEAGSSSFVDEQQELFSRGFSFSGYERDLLSLNLGDGHFLNISGVSGVDSITDGRATVFADFDDDGDTDVFLNTIQGSSRLLFRNQVGAENGHLRITLEGTVSGRDAFGAVVRVKSAAGTQTKIKTGGTGYLAQSDPRLLFGLGTSESVSAVKVTWPSGLVQSFGPMPAHSSWKLVEGRKEPIAVHEKATSLPDPISEEERALAGIRVRRGDRLPEAPVLSLDGEERMLAADIGQPHWTLINIWATWCESCRHEMPILAELQREMGADQLQVIGLSIDGADQAEKVAAFVAEHRIPYRIEIATPEAVELFFDSEQLVVPLSVLVGSDGTVVEVLPGWSARIEQRLREAIGTEDAGDDQ